MDYKLAYLLNEPNKKYSFEDIQKRYGLSKDQLLKETGGLITNNQEDEFHLKHISIEAFTKASLELSDEEVYEFMSKASNPYGDGTASKQIVDILLKK